MPRIHQRSAGSSPVFTPSAADSWLPRWLAGSWLLGWARVAGGGAWKEEKRRREGEAQGIREEEAEAEGRRGLSGGVHGKRWEGEIRAREVTVLPLPSLFHSFDSPNLTLLV